MAATEGTVIKAEWWWGCLPAIPTSCPYTEQKQPIIISDCHWTIRIH